MSKMQEFIIPPQMDFVSYPEAIEPFAMYIFDFEYKLDKDDLLYIWQGLLPPSAQKHKKLSRRVAHQLKDNAILSKKDLMENPDIKWIVFKVKQRANTNYFDKIYLQNGQSNYLRQQPQGKFQAVPENTLTELSPNREITYNWPYDFFSFIELIKVNTAVHFKGVDPDTGKEIKLAKNADNVSRIKEMASKMTRPFGGD